MSTLRTALEEAIFANPDDRAAHSAYADLLIEEGDQRGEFIQVQLALEDPACTGDHRKELKHRERNLLAHEADWLGPLAQAIRGSRKFADEPSGRADWARGWLESVYLWWFDFAAAHALVASPAARILRRLDLHHVMWYDAGDKPKEGILPEDNVPTDNEFTPLYALQRAPFLPHLRWLRVGEEVNFDDDTYNNEAHAQGLVELLEKTPALEELHVLAKGTDLDRLFALGNLSRLRDLLVYHHSAPYPLEVLAANAALPALETLRFHPAHSDGEGSYLPGAGVAALLHSPHFPALRHLHVRGSDLGDEGCQQIVSSGILQRLKVLDLSYGRITDAGAQILAECPDIRHLEQLSLMHNQLSDAGCNLLEGLGIDVRVDGQDDPGSDGYLWYGDME